MVRYELSLCIGQESTNRGVIIKCHDEGISLAIRLVTCHQVSKWRMVEEPFAIPSGSTAFLKISKPDKTKCVVDGKMDGAGILFKLPPQACTVEGTSDAEVSVYGADGGRVTSATFPIHVPPECVCNCEMESEPYVDIMGSQIRAAIEAKSEAKAAAEAAKLAQVNTPKIGNNGNWLCWDFEKSEYVDTGVSAIPSAELESMMVKSVNGESPQDGNIDIYLGGDADRHAEYFTITDDGIISLKPEYRGACNREDFPYAISDNGSVETGSRNSELPKYLVIPEVVGTTAVAKLAPGMLMYNHAVETIVLPSTVVTIPERFCEGSASIRNLYNTERITSVEKVAFQCCGIEKAKFPNLTVLGAGVFNNAGLLKYADIGKVTDIPMLCFASCNNLSMIRGGADVTSVGAMAFQMTYRLNSVEFLPKLKSIGQSAFVRCRLIYDWGSLTGCSFGSNATAKQLNPTNIWSTCTVTPTENALPTLLSQIHPTWKNKQIGTSGINYSGGCIFFSVMHAFCALKGIVATTADELAEIAIANSSDPDILNNFDATNGYITTMCEALGLKLDYYKSYNKASLQAVYDKIKEGSYAILLMAGLSGNTGHSALAYGVKANKEFLVADSAFSPGEYVGCTDQGIKYSMVYQNMISPSSGVYIISL